MGWSLSQLPPSKRHGTILDKSSARHMEPWKQPAWRPLSRALVTTSRNFSCLFASCASANRKEELFLVSTLCFSPAVTNVGVFFIGQRRLRWLIPVQIESATAFAKSCWTAAADVIQGSLSLSQWACWCLHLPSDVVDWMD